MYYISMTKKQYLKLKLLDAITIKVGNSHNKNSKSYYLDEDSYVTVANTCDGSTVTMKVRELQNSNILCMNFDKKMCEFQPLGFVSEYWFNVLAKYDAEIWYTDSHNYQGHMSSKDLVQYLPSYHFYHSIPLRYILKTRKCLQDKLSSLYERAFLFSMSGICYNGKLVRGIPHKRFEDSKNSIVYLSQDCKDCICVYEDNIGFWTYYIKEGVVDDTLFFYKNCSVSQLIRSADFMNFALSHGALGFLE